MDLEEIAKRLRELLARTEDAITNKQHGAHYSSVLNDTMRIEREIIIFAKELD